MKRSRFQAPRIIRDFAAVVRALREIQESLDGISARRAELAINLKSFNLSAGTFQRASAPSGGMQARLPKASGENLGESIVLHLEGMLGILSIFAAPGDTVNGLTRADFTDDGVVVLWSNGVDAWSGVAQLPENSPGAAGAQGPKGDQGEKGEQGDTGDRGQPGPQGIQGERGLPGDKGEQGDPGDPGPPGVQGGQGPQGLQGPPGPDFAYDQGEPIHQNVSTAQLVKENATLMSLSSISGNQGTVDISALECGGTLGIATPAGAWQIEGFTSTPEKPQGFWFRIVTSNTNFVGTLLNEDTTPAADLRIRCVQDRHMSGVALTAIVTRTPVITGGNSRWFAVGTPGKLVGSDGTNNNTLDLNEGGNVSLTCGATTASMTLAAGSGAVNLTCSAGQHVIASVGGVGGTFRSTSGLTAQGTSGGSSTYTKQSGEIEYRGDNSRTPSRPAYSDDAGNSWTAPCAICAGLTSRTTVNNSTSPNTLATYTVPADMPAGTTFRFSATVEGHRGATATAMGTTLEFRVAGTARVSATASLNTTNGFTGLLTIEGYFTLLAAPGAAAAVSATGTAMQTLTSATAAVAMSTPNAALTQATNATFTIDIRAFNSVAVASAGFTTQNARIERIA